MEVMCHAECATDPLPYEVSPDATAAQVLHDVCALFGREDEDTALEVDGVEVCVSGGGENVEVSSVGLHADSRVVVKRSRERVLALVAKEEVWTTRSKDDWGLPEWVWGDLLVMTAIAKKDGRSLELASAEMQKTPSVVKEAVKRHGSSLRFTSAELRNAPSIVIEAVQNNGLSLEFASPELQNTPEIVKAAVKGHGHCLRFASPAMRNTPDVVIAAVQKNGWTIESASLEMRNTHAVMLAAVKQNGWSLEFASDELKNTPEIIDAAIKEDGRSLRFASYALRNTPSVVLEAVQRHGDALQYASDEMRARKAIIRAAVKQNKHARCFAMKGPAPKPKAPAAKKPEAKQRQQQQQQQQKKKKKKKNNNRQTPLPSHTFLSQEPPRLPSQVLSAPPPGSLPACDLPARVTSADIMRAWAAGHDTDPPAPKRRRVDFYNDDFYPSGELSRGWMVNPQTGKVSWVE